ncbi:MAG: 23S rRNA (uracil(1939)-C(5))-methyltransferase RlmD [Oscillospiraceae bacterium]|nr:23S rRNA (uracil(1939)-C(5))-methyltransferase RlmD [Oscillospiraceae bacterium]
MDKLKKNQIFTARIDGYSSEGLGVARLDGAVVFVKGAIAGELCDIRIMKVGKNASFGKVERLIEASPERIEPVCNLRGCGGCDLGHMSYKEELEFKRRRVADAMKRIGNLDIEVLPPLPADTTVSYRNKAIFNAGTVSGSPVFGFFRQRTHDVVPAESCAIQSPAASAAAAAVREYMIENNISVYDETVHKGLVRSLFVRQTNIGSQICLVINGKNIPAAEKLVEKVRAAVPDVCGILLSINTARGNTILGHDFITLWGDDVLSGIMCGLRFHISPASFYQINTPQAERLYNTAIAMAGNLQGKTVFNLYCGIGTISLCLAKTAGKVIGAEIVPDAVENARKNARLNGFDNVEFILADASQAAVMLEKQGELPDIVTVDPPRKGLSPDVIEIICRMSPEKVVYISCDCATMARDMKLFAQFGYKSDAVQPVDMFPRTRHIECAALLEKIK